MKKINLRRLAVLFFVALFVLVSGQDLSAQQKKGKGGKEKGQKKETVEKVAGEKKEMKERADSLSRGGEKTGYRPKRLGNEEAAQWEGDRPPGWSRGGKTGWSGADMPKGQKKGDAERNREMKRRYPPGAKNWDDKKKEKWDKHLEESKDRVRRKAHDKRGAAGKYGDSAVISIEEAARGGVPVDKAEAVVEKAIERDMEGEEIEKMTRAMTYGADKNVDYEKLDTFIGKKIDSGERGDDLAVSIYKEIDSGSLEKTEETKEEKKSVWKRIFKRD
ncbi:MAG: hypothetical protein JW814_06640 [Candidatus Krumholzibacteriota bacterium]|nr:hypothetical protein [Candidatus Krumholzibacteriota bacterium]